VFNFQEGKFESDCDPDEKIIIKLMDILDEYHGDIENASGREYANDIIKIVRENDDN